MLPRKSRFVQPYLCCNRHIFLLYSYLSRMGRTENSFCCAYGYPNENILVSFCPVHRPTICTFRFLATPFPFTPHGPGLGELFGFCSSAVFRNAPILRKGSFDNSNHSSIDCIYSSSGWRHGMKWLYFGPPRTQSKLSCGKATVLLQTNFKCL